MLPMTADGPGFAGSRFDPEVCAMSRGFRRSSTRRARRGGVPPIPALRAPPGAGTGSRAISTAGAGDPSTSVSRRRVRPGSSPMRPRGSMAICSTSSAAASARRRFARRSTRRALSSLRPAAPAAGSGDAYDATEAARRLWQPLPRHRRHPRGSLPARPGVSRAAVSRHFASIPLCSTATAAACAACPRWSRP